MCKYRFSEHTRRFPNYQKYYYTYIVGRRTLKEIALLLDVSIPTIRKKFDGLRDIRVSLTQEPSVSPLSLIVDATFFGREYGFFCFCDSDRNKLIHYREIETENLESFIQSLDEVVKAGYRFKSFTLDGKRGFINLLKQRFPNTPIQMCQFHQKQIVRRYITDNPKTLCGIELKELMTTMKNSTYVEFKYELLLLEARYKSFLKERNENNRFMHRRLRSAFRSLKTNLPYLFTYNKEKYLDLNIPNTSNKLEGMFSHLKERIKIHRGLNKERKKQAIRFFLYTKSVDFLA